MTPVRCICEHDSVLHALLASGVRAGRCAGRLCVCGSTAPSSRLVAEVRQLVARTVSRFRRRPAPARHRTAPVVSPPVEDLDLYWLFRAGTNHTRAGRNQVPAAYRPVRPRNSAPRV